MRVRRTDYMIGRIPSHTPKAVETFRQKYALFREIFRDDPAKAFSLYMTSCTYDGRLSSTSAIKGTLCHWIELHPEQKDLAARQCREWIEKNRHLFKRRQ